MNIKFKRKTLARGHGLVYIAMLVEYILQWRNILILKKAKVLKKDCDSVLVLFCFLRGSWGGCGHSHSCLLLGEMSLLGNWSGSVICCDLTLVISLVYCVFWPASVLLVCQ